MAKLFADGAHLRRDGIAEDSLRTNEFVTHGPRNVGVRSMARSTASSHSLWPLLLTSRRAMTVPVGDPMLAFGVNVADGRIVHPRVAEALA